MTLKLSPLWTAIACAGVIAALGVLLGLGRAVPAQLWAVLGVLLIAHFAAQGGPAPLVPNVIVALALLCTVLALAIEGVAVPAYLWAFLLGALTGHFSVPAVSGPEGVLSALEAPSAPTGPPFVQSAPANAQGPLLGS